MSPAKRVRCSVACFGEVLWDILPRGIFLGGAPANVSYHLTRLGVSALPVSAVGRDFLGEEALARIAAWPADTSCIGRPRRRPTGTVRARLDAAGSATYEIADRVAWDRIRAERTLRRRPAPAALVYGTLAMRGGSNRVAFMDLAQAWPEAFRVLDLNLRPPFDQPRGVRFALGYAQLVKLNDAELVRQTGLPVRTSAELEAAARRFARQDRRARVCVTAGARGAGLLWDDAWHWAKGNKVAVRDTVGAGDAFLAGWIAGYFKWNESPGVALARACRLGEFVAARDGATPPYVVDADGHPRDAIRGWTA